jgi:SAM-dependent methyltransferase
MVEPDDFSRGTDGSSSESGRLNGVYEEMLSKFRSVRDKVALTWIWATSHDHSEAFERWMDYRIYIHGARAAVGGFDMGIGELQLEFLKREGMQAEHTFLDVGCGSLRGGRYFIDYLEEGNYTGMDINESIILEGKSIVDEDLLVEKDPTFVVNDDLQFDEFEGTFDFILALSVLTHLPRPDIEECLTHVHKVMDSGSRFYFTYFDPQIKDYTGDSKSFSYSRNTLAQMANENDLTIHFVDPEEFPHPRNQRMAQLQLG